MIQLHAKVLEHALHLRLQLILHPPPTRTEKLPDFGKPKNHVAAEEHQLKHHVAAQIDHLIPPRQIWTLYERPRSPRARNLDAVHRRAEELVVSLHDPKIPSQKDQLLGPLGLVAEDFPDALAHLLLHLEMALRSFLFRKLREALAGAVVAARVRAQQGGRGEDVDVVDAPGLDDIFERAVVEGHEGLPEKGVLVPEGGLHLDVEAVVDEDELGLAVGFAADEDVSGVGVAVL